MEELKTAEDAITFIHNTQKFGSKLGLAGITELLRRLGNPQDDLRFIHIAGTNGKGSVAAMTACILKNAGYKVGLYTSPFIERFHERIRIGDTEISDDALLSCTRKVQTAIADMMASGFAHPTEFEIVTAIGMLYFRDEACDMVVLEVGLGGRLDATNVIKTPILCVICALSYDHTEYLGNTLSEIAAEKCGILKPDVPVVVYQKQDPEALSTVLGCANDKSCEVFFSKDISSVTCTPHGTSFSADGKDYSLALLGAHQTENAATVLSVVEVLRKKGFSVPEDALRKGFAEVRWMGRFEVLGKHPLFITDGAHNPAGIRTFADTVHTLFPDKKKIFIMGMLRDKDFEESLAILNGEWDTFFAVTVPNHRTLSADELAAVARKYGKNVYVSDTKAAVSTALAENDPDTVIFAFGSLYLLSDIRAFYFANQKKEDA